MKTCRWCYYHNPDYAVSCHSCARPLPSEVCEPSLTYPTGPIGVRAEGETPIPTVVVPVSSEDRKATPIATGLLDYFPDAIVELARLSYDANEQHNPGEPVHWARERSDDHDDCAMRHFMDRGKRDTDGKRHTAKAAWRLLAMLQLEIEKDRG